MTYINNRYMDTPLADIATDLNRLQNTLYGEGITHFDPPGFLLKQEDILTQAYRLKILEHFGSATKIPGDLFNAIKQINPNGERANINAITSIRNARDKNLPYGPEDENTPFGVLGRGIQPYKMTTIPIGSRHTSTTRITTDEHGKDLHFCFSHVADSTDTAPMNAIENLATHVYKNLGLKAWFKNFHFYVHVPAECTSDRKQFLKVSMKQERAGHFLRPAFEGQNTIPAGIHMAMNLTTDPVPANTHDEKSWFDDYRRWAAPAYQRELNAG